MHHENTKKTLLRLPKLMLGFIIIAVGINLTIYANMGLNPWGTFHQGVSNITGIRFGTVSQLTGIVIILLSLFIKLYPGIGTILNMIFIGYFVDLFDQLHLIPLPDTFTIRTIYLLLGTLLFNYGIFVYLSCELGAGPRDGLLVGLVKMTGLNVSIMRPIIEVTIVAIGILLGGSYGVGTLLNAFGGGYILNTIFNFYKFNPKATKQMVITDLIKAK
ncbi:YczE/YyaS/YitT family protein [Fusibacter bizertensis]